MAPDRYLIVGLGNPGPEYENTRHNAGYLAIDHIAAETGGAVVTEKMQGLYGILRLAGRQVYLLKPLTYMNRSGECIVKYANYYDIQPGCILLIHDDLDLECGKVKITTGGGSGGHKGIQSTIRHLGTKDFSRIKIGIGRPGMDGEHEGIPVEKYVLSKFSESQWQKYLESLEKVVEGVNLFVSCGVDAAMNRVNVKSRSLRQDE